MRFLQGLERSVQRNRAFVLPSHIRTWLTIQRDRKAVPGPASAQPIAALDLVKLAAEQDGGRYLYQLVHVLNAGGYHVAFRNRYRFVAGLGGRRFKKLLLRRPFTVFDDSCGPPDPPNASLFISDLPTEDRCGAGWTPIRVSYEERHPTSDNDIALPYGMFPLVTEAGRLIPEEEARSGTGRICRLFFAGRVQRERYDRPELARFGLLNRMEVIDEARRAAGERFREGVLPGDHEVAAQRGMERRSEREFRGFHLSTGKAGDPTRWLDVLRRVEVFLACPGRTMPLAHSTIEALHAGAVPLLQHPHYFHPPLEDGVNALVYRDRAELRARVSEVLEMDAEEIARLRQGAVDYYYTHLRPERVADRLKARVGTPGTTLLFNWFLAPKRGVPLGDA